MIFEEIGSKALAVGVVVLMFYAAMFVRARSYPDYTLPMSFFAAVLSVFLAALMLALYPELERYGPSPS